MNNARKYNYTKIGVKCIFLNLIHNLSGIWSLLEHDVKKWLGSFEGHLFGVSFVEPDDNCLLIDENMY